MTGSPEVLRLDDGELEDVQEILAEFGTSYGRIRGGAIAQGTPPPRKLLVTTPRRIEAIDLGDTKAMVRMVVVDEDSPTLRAHLRAVGFDYLVRRPVHPQALRLMLMRCLYNGDERRHEPRVPMGLRVSFRSGMLSRRAILADLSTSGCRLLSRWAISIGSHIRVTLPPRKDTRDAVSVTGAVVRIGLDEHLGPDGPYSAAVAFDTSIPVEAREALEQTLDDRARGPATLGAGGRTLPDDEWLPTPQAQRGAPEPSATEPSLDPPETRAGVFARDVGLEVDVQLETEKHPGAAQRAEEDPLAKEATERALAPGFDETLERRSGHRGAYPLRVPAFGDRAIRVLLARDLSMGGMRVERDSGLELGDRLHLAIYGSAHKEPFLVWATADRDDGDNGLLLRFDEMHPEFAKQLDKLVASLPAVESLHDDEARAMGSVVTEIL
jgi:hypothetical protein